MDLNDAKKAGIPLKDLMDAADTQEPVVGVDLSRAAMLGLQRLQELAGEVERAQSAADICRLIMGAHQDEEFRRAAAHALIGRETDVLSIIGTFEAIRGAGAQAKLLRQILTKEATQIREVLRRDPETQSLDVLLRPLGIRGLNAPYGWEVDRDGISVDGNRVTTRPLVVIGRAFDVDSGKAYLELAWTVKGDWKRQWFPASVIASSRDILELSGYDAPIHSANALPVVKYLAQFKDGNDLPVQRLCRRMGWIDRDTFICGKLVLGDDVCVQPDDAADIDRLARIRNDGSWQGWCQTVAEVNHLPIPMIAIYASVASPMLHMLGVPGFIVDIWGESQHGKTTTLMGAASVWGPPSFERGPLLKWNQRITGIEHNAWFMQSLPLLLDETQVAHAETLSNAAYCLPDGAGKTRGKVDGSTHKAKTWELITISTGERAMTSGDYRLGAISRALSLWGEPFGPKSDENGKVALAFERGLHQHYGIAGPMVVRYLMETGEEELRRQFADHLGVMRKAAGVLATQSTRSAVFGAVVRMGGSILHRLGLPGSVDAPINYLIDVAYKAAYRDVAQEAVQATYAWAVANERKFQGRDPTAMEPHQGWLGFWDGSFAWREIAFVPAKLQHHLESCGFDYHVIYESWKGRGWLVLNGKTGRNPVRGGAGTTCVVLNRAALES